MPEQKSHRSEERWLFDELPGNDSRRPDLALLAMFGGALSSLMAACIVGILL